MQTFFFFASKLFDLNNFLFHLIAFLIYFFNISLIHKLISRMFTNRNIAYVCIFLWATAAFNFMTLSWLSLTWNLIGLTFMLLSLLSFLEFKSTDKSSSQIKTFIFFVIGLLSSEFVIFTPIYIAAIDLLMSKTISLRQIKNVAKFLTAYAFVILAYLSLRILIYPIPAIGVYKIDISLNVIREYFWYALWLFNIPEQLKYHLVISKLSFSNDPTFVARPFLVATVGLAVYLVTTLSYLILKSSKKYNLRYMFLAIILFAISLSPVVILQTHSYPYYLTVASLPVLIVISKLLGENISGKDLSLKILSYIALIIWILSSVFSNQVNIKTHWLTGEQSISKKITSEAKKQYPKLEGNETLVIYPSSNQTKISLMNQDAMNVIYNTGINTKFISKIQDYLPQANERILIWQN